MRNEEKKFIEFIDKSYRYKKKYRYVLLSKKISINHIETQHYNLLIYGFKNSCPLSVCNIYGKPKYANT